MRKEGITFQNRKPESGGFQEGLTWAGDVAQVSGSAARLACVLRLDPQHHINKDVETKMLCSPKAKKKKKKRA